MLFSVLNFNWWSHALSRIDSSALRMAKPELLTWVAHPTDISRFCCSAQTSWQSCTPVDNRWSQCCKCTSRMRKRIYVCFPCPEDRTSLRRCLSCYRTEQQVHRTRLVRRCQIVSCVAWLGSSYSWRSLFSFAFQQASTPHQHFRRGFPSIDRGSFRCNWQTLRLSGPRCFWLSLFVSYLTLYSSCLTFQSQGQRSLQWSYSVAFSTSSVGSPLV